MRSLLIVTRFSYSVFPADLPHAHVTSGGGEGLAEELADLVGV